jgi:hypothetical protein
MLLFTGRRSVVWNGRLNWEINATRLKTCPKTYSGMATAFFSAAIIFIPTPRFAPVAVILTWWWKTLWMKPFAYDHLFSCSCMRRTRSASFSEVRLSRMLSTFMGKQNGVKRCG